MNATLDCEQCRMRQWDEDCRNVAALPADVLTHLNECSECRAEWQHADECDRLLHDAMRCDVPASVYRRAYVAAVDDEKPQQRSMRRWFRYLHALLAGAIAAAVWLSVPLTAAYPLMAVAVFALCGMTIYLYDYYDECRQPEL